MERKLKGWTRHNQVLKSHLEFPKAPVKLYNVVWNPAIKNLDLKTPLNCNNCQTFFFRFFFCSYPIFRVTLLNCFLFYIFFLWSLIIKVIFCKGMMFHRLWLLVENIQSMKSQFFSNFWKWFLTFEGDLRKFHKLSGFN